MPTHATTAPADVDPNELSPLPVACPQSLYPAVLHDESTVVERETASPAMSPPASDNTAAGMSLLQEESMYGDAPEMAVDEKENVDPSEEHTIKRHVDSTPPDTRLVDFAMGSTAESKPAAAEQSHSPVNNQLSTPSPTISSASPRPAGTVPVPSCDHELNLQSEAKPWDFTQTPLSTSVPSSLFRPFARYTGTQQSDRQIYNVCVTLLTIDVAQSTMSGYLEICGLTPDHPELTTFFTGEIIGGPKQRYSFRTKDSTWGASNKTDMTHWARFPAWRPLSPHAKNDMDFVHPVDGSDWWQQEHIFMRWKEHFLVPDYKLRSIQGASFEGFYYICLNQVEGRISGIYFHSKSEK